MSDFIEIDIGGGRKARFPKGMTRAEMAEALNSFPSTPQGGVSTNSGAVKDFEGKASSAVMGGAQGAMFGLEDNIAGVRGILGQVPKEDGTVGIDYSVPTGERYNMMRDDARRTMQEAEDANPKAFNTGKVGGATVTALASAPFATGGTMLGTMGRGGVIGGIEGALHGFGNSDGQDVFENTLYGGGVGLGTGIAAPALVGVASRGKDILTGGVDAVLNRENKTKAGRAIGDVLRQSGKSADDVSRSVAMAAREGQPEYRVMDATGVAGQRSASGIARSGGDAAAEIAEYLQKRQGDQGDRVGSFVEDAFGFRGASSGETLPIDPANPPLPTPGAILSGPQVSAKQTGDALTAARKARADVEYDAARGNAAPVDVRGVVSVIDDRLGPLEGNEWAEDSIDGIYNKYRNRLINEAPEGSAELSDFNRVLNLKQDLQTEMKKYVGTPAYSQLKKIEGALDDALEGSSDGYRKANDNFRDASRVIDAVPEGAQMATRGRAADNVPRFESMTPDQKSAARVGYGDSLLDKMERVTAPTSNRAKPLQSTKRESEAAAMTVAPDLYARRLARENEMWETQNRALGGSRTADNQADQEAMGELAGGALDVARSGANMQFGDMAAKIGGLIGPIAKGQNEATRQAIARALMSKDPQAALAPLLRKDMTSQSIRRITEALLRNSGREAVTQ